MIIWVKYVILNCGMAGAASSLCMRLKESLEIQFNSHFDWLSKTRHSQWLARKLGPIMTWAENNENNVYGVSTSLVLALIIAPYVIGTFLLRLPFTGTRWGRWLRFRTKRIYRKVNKMALAKAQAPKVIGVDH